MDCSVVIPFYAFIYEVSAYTLKYPFDTEPLKCYVCNREMSNSNCLDDDDGLKPCKEGYDTCMTTTEYSDVSEKMFITKRCSKKEACYRQINQTRLTHPCDKNKPSWICTDCCFTEYCNENGSARARFNWLWGFSLLIYFII